MEKIAKNKDRAGFFTERVAVDDTDRKITKKHKSPFSFKQTDSVDDPTLDLGDELC